MTRPRRYRLRAAVWLIRRVAIPALDLIAGACDRFDEWNARRRDTRNNPRGYMRV